MATGVFDGDIVSSSDDDLEDAIHTGGQEKRDDDLSVGVEETKANHDDEDGENNSAPTCDDVHSDSPLKKFWRT